MLNHILSYFMFIETAARLPVMFFSNAFELYFSNQDKNYIFIL